ncbi:MAG: mechanosensitive ion channel family protein [Verrucomicrobia bacterium]|jgi:small conductance mechanosensitive channel|nr:mechanosensitive ion channel family protein [Verrucomicrobiota bacterium]
MTNQLESLAQAKEKLVEMGTEFAPQALTAVNDVLTQNPLMLRDPAPVVGVSLLADSSIHLGIKPWVKVQDFVPASGAVNKAVVEAFRARGISIPFPQRKVRLIQAAG